MATPAWVRQHRRHQHDLHTIAILELNHQAEQRVETEREHDEAWTPRQGVTFASEQ